MVAAFEPASRQSKLRLERKENKSGEAQREDKTVDEREQTEKAGDKRQRRRREEDDKRQRAGENEAAGITRGRGEVRGAIAEFICDSVDATHDRDKIQLESFYVSFTAEALWSMSSHVSFTW